MTKPLCNIHRIDIPAQIYNFCLRPNLQLSGMAVDMNEQYVIILSLIILFIYKFFIQYNFVSLYICLPIQIIPILFLSYKNNPLIQSVDG